MSDICSIGPARAHRVQPSYGQLGDQWWGARAKARSFLQYQRSRDGNAQWDRRLRGSESPAPGGDGVV